MKSKILVIEKAPSRNKYKELFKFDFELVQMCSQPPAGKKVLKRDIDLEIDLDPYDLVICVGAEAAKEYAGIKTTSTLWGTLVDDKYVSLQNPGMLHFKPEMKPEFEMALAKIHKIVTGEIKTLNFNGRGITNAEVALEYLEYLRDNEQFNVIALDTEGTALAPRDGYVLGVSITHTQDQGVYILTDILDERHLDILQHLADTRIIVMHNLKYDRKMIEYHLGVKFRKLAQLHDTMCMHYILDENDAHGLKHLAQKFTNYGDYDADLDRFKKDYCKSHGIKEEDFTYDLIPFDIMWTYASKDTAVTWILYHKFIKSLEANAKLMRAYRDLMMRSTMFLCDMEEVGIPFSLERLTAALELINKDISDAEAELMASPEVQAYCAATEAVFNPNSPIQLRRLLFDYLNLTPTGRLTDTGQISTDADALIDLAKQHPLPALLLKIRKMGKIRGTYLENLVNHVDRDGRIRTNFNNTFVTSGRLSSSGKFNAQQIPRDDPIIKGTIVAPEGYKIVSQDLQTGEMYYAAVLSGDKNLQKVFLEGGDFHSSIAKMVFNLPGTPDEVKKKFKTLRQSAKAISFGILYGSGPQKVADTVTESLQESGSKETYSITQAREDIDTYFSTFSQLKRWLNSRKEFIEANGFTYSYFGRKRRLPNVFSSDRGIAAGQVRSGINSEIQSLCSDVNLLGAMDTHDELLERKMKARIFMLVHDSIVALVPDDEVELYCAILKRNTQKDRGCGIPGCPIGVDQEIGQDYSFGKWDDFYKFEGSTLSRVQATK